MVAPALLIVDVQRAIDHPRWGDDRNNRDAEANIARLLARWRERGWPVVHIRHASREPNSTYRKGQPGFEFKAEVMPREGEQIVEKQTNSAFIGTDLQQRLSGITTLVIAGVITNIPDEPRARMAR